MRLGWVPLSFQMGHVLLSHNSLHSAHGVHSLYVPERWRHLSLLSLGWPLSSLCFLICQIKALAKQLLQFPQAQMLILPDNGPCLCLHFGQGGQGCDGSSQWDCGPSRDVNPLKVDVPKGSEEHPRKDHFQVFPGQYPGNSDNPPVVAGCHCKEPASWHSPRCPLLPGSLHRSQVQCCGAESRHPYRSEPPPSTYRQPLSGTIPLLNSLECSSRYHVQAMKMSEVKMKPLILRDSPPPRRRPPAAVLVRAT